MQPEMYDMFHAEKESFNTPAEKEAIERIYPLCTSIALIMR